MKIIRFEEKYLDEAAICFAENFTEDNERIWSVAKSKEYLLRNVKNYPDYCAVAISEEGDYIGDIYCRLEPYYDTYFLFLDIIQVKKEYRKQGIAKNLTDYVVKKAKQNGITGMNILIDQRADFPLNWYKAMGFKPTGWTQYEIMFDEIKL